VWWTRCPPLASQGRATGAPEARGTSTPTRPCAVHVRTYLAQDRGAVAPACRVGITGGTQSFVSDVPALVIGLAARVRPILQDFESPTPPARGETWLDRADIRSRDGAPSHSRKKRRAWAESWPPSSSPPSRPPNAQVRHTTQGFPPSLPKRGAQPTQASCRPTQKGRVWDARHQRALVSCHDREIASSEIALLARLCWHIGQ
jgi:hypothetical protein